MTELKSQTEAMAKALGVVGLMNVQYAIQGGEIFVLAIHRVASAGLSDLANTRKACAGIGSTGRVSSQ